MLDAFFVGTAVGITRAPEFFRCMIAESEKSFAHVPDSGRYQEMVRQFQRVVDAGLARGDVRADYPPQLLAELLVGAYLSPLRCWRTQLDYPLRQQLRRAASFMAEALSPERVS